MEPTESSAEKEENWMMLPKVRGGSIVCKSHAIDREEGDEKASGMWSNSNAYPKLRAHVGAR